MRLSFIIPCYHSELTIGNVVGEIRSKMSEKPDIDYEIIAVNDSSPDDVLTVLKELAEKDKRVMVVDLAKNVGKHGAEMAGFSFASGDFIVALDDDGQCPMDKLWELIEPLYNGYDISIAKYPIKKQSAFKNFGSKMNALMAQFLIEKPRSLYLSNFSAMKRFVVDEMKKYDDAHGNDYDSHKRYETVMNGFSKHMRKNSTDCVEKTKRLLKGEYGVICQYDREPDFETVWSSVFDLKSLMIWCAEGDPRKKKFLEDKRLCEAKQLPDACKQPPGSLSAEIKKEKLRTKRAGRSAAIRS